MAGTGERYAALRAESRPAAARPPLCDGRAPPFARMRAREGAWASSSRSTAARRSPTWSASATSPTAWPRTKAGRPRRRRRRLGDGRHDRRAARARPQGQREPLAARAGHAPLRRRAHLDGPPLDGARGARGAGGQLHRLAVGDHHERRPRERAHHRGAPVPRAGRAGARARRDRRRLPGRLVQARGHDARARRLRHDGRRARRGARGRGVRDLQRRGRRLLRRPAGRARGAAARRDLVRGDAGARRGRGAGAERAGRRVREGARDRDLRPRHPRRRRRDRRAPPPAACAGPRGRSRERDGPRAACACRRANQRPSWPSSSAWTQARPPGSSSGSRPRSARPSSSRSRTSTTSTRSAPTCTRASPSSRSSRAWARCPRSVPASTRASGTSARRCASSSRSDAPILGIATSSFRISLLMDGAAVNEAARRLHEGLVEAPERAASEP